MKESKKKIRVMATMEMTVVTPTNRRARERKKSLRRAKARKELQLEMMMVMTSKWSKSVPLKLSKSLTNSTRTITASGLTKMSRRTTNRTLTDLWHTQRCSLWSRTSLRSELMTCSRLNWRT